MTTDATADPHSSLGTPPAAIARSRPSAAVGPLAGVKVVELAGIGPGPFAAMTLAELGADVIRADRPGTGPDALPERLDLLRRGRPSLECDLRTPTGVETVLTLVEHADLLIEGNRPGVTERLGLGPDDCWQRNLREGCS